LKIEIGIQHLRAQHRGNLRPQQRHLRRYR
jgi:hypothetical protein